MVKFLYLFNIFIMGLETSAIIAIYFIFTEYIFLKIIGILALCIYAFIIGIFTAFDWED